MEKLLVLMMILGLSGCAEWRRDNFHRQKYTHFGHLREKQWQLPDPASARWKSANKLQERTPDITAEMNNTVPEDVSCDTGNVDEPVAEIAGQAYGIRKKTTSESNDICQEAAARGERPPGTSGRKTAEQHLKKIQMPGFPFPGLDSRTMFIISSIILLLLFISLIALLAASASLSEIALFYLLFVHIPLFLGYMLAVIIRSLVYLQEEHFYEFPVFDRVLLIIDGVIFLSAIILVIWALRNASKWGF